MKRRWMKQTGIQYISVNDDALWIHVGIVYDIVVCVKLKVIYSYLCRPGHAIP